MEYPELSKAKSQENEPTPSENPATVSKSNLTPKSDNNPIKQEIITKPISADMQNKSSKETELKLEKKQSTESRDSTREKREIPTPIKDLPRDVLNKLLQLKLKGRLEEMKKKLLANNP